METHNPMKCKARSKQTQQQCRNTPIPGGTVCRMHGGASPVVARKAAERIAAARDRALDAFTGLVDQGKIDARTSLDAVVRLTETTETLEGRVARREETVSVSEVDRELERLANELRARTSRQTPVVEDSPT